MENNTFFKDYREHVTFRQGRYGKTTLFENEHVLAGLNCLEPGQAMEKNAHQVQCRFYTVLEGRAQVTIGDAQQNVGQGMVFWVPAGNAHRILNNGAGRLVLLVGITPAQAD